MIPAINARTIQRNFKDFLEKLKTYGMVYITYKGKKVAKVEYTEEMDRATKLKKLKKVLDELSKLPPVKLPKNMSYKELYHKILEEKYLRGR